MHGCLGCADKLVLLCIRHLLESEKQVFLRLVAVQVLVRALCSCIAVVLAIFRLQFAHSGHQLLGTEGVSATILHLKYSIIQIIEI